MKKSIKLITLLLTLICLIISCTTDPLAYCNVIIDKANGEALSTVEVLVGSEYKLPSSPSKANHTFDGWYLNGNKITTPTIIVNETITITAHYIRNQYDDSYTIHYMFRNMDRAGDGRELYSEEVPALTEIDLSQKIKDVDGFTFTNWYLTDSTRELAPNTLTITDDTYIYGFYNEYKEPSQQVTITFIETDGNTWNEPRLSKKTLNSNSSLNYIDKDKIKISETYCYYLAAYHDESMTEEIELPYTFTKDEIIYVKYTPETVKIIRHGYKGSSNNEPSPITIGKGAKYYLDKVSPYYNVKEEIFEGWYLDSSFAESVSTTPTIINEDTDIYAKWSKDYYTITYHFDDYNAEEDEIDVEYVRKGTDYAIKEKSDAKKGFESTGWYYDSKFTQKAEGTITVDKDIDLYQEWIVQNKLLEIYLNNGQPNIEKWLPVGSIFDLSTIPEPERDGYKFVGWGTSNSLSDIVESTKIKVKSSGNRYYALFDNSWNAFADYSWFNTSENTFYIDTPEKLAGIAYLVNNEYTDFKGKTIKLTKDIDLSEHEWIPIGKKITDFNDGNIYNVTEDDFHLFKGTFDGKGKQIRGLIVNKENIQDGIIAESCYNGLFGAVGDRTIIKNTTIDNANIYGDSFNAAFVAYIPKPTASKVYGVTLENLNVINSTFKTQSNTGAILGRSESDNTLVNISNCSVSNSEMKYINKHDYRDFFGGIVGVLYGASNNTISSCSVDILTIEACSDLAGGIAGAINKATIENPSITNTQISLLSENSTIGFIVGGLTGTTSNLTISGEKTTENTTLSPNGIYCDGYVGAIVDEYQDPTQNVVIQ